MNIKAELTFFLLALAGLNAMAAGWAPAGEGIRTPWADEVTPSNVLPEYPRPAMIRSEWQNLNGLWNYAITPLGAQYNGADGQILVPFCIESSLSGVGRMVGKDNVLWYEREFTIPGKWKGKEIILHFGAVDFQTEVWVNGSKVGGHTGGYTPFCYNITGFLKKSGKQTLRVRVYDQTDLAWQPRGKQVAEPKGIWYTPVTGIWQTVWLEPVAKTHIRSYEVSSDIDKSQISFKVSADNLGETDRIVVSVLDGGVGYNPEKPSEMVIAQTVAKDGVALLDIPSMQTWSPSNPYIYGVKISLERKGKTLDSVLGYTTMRKISRLDMKDPANKPNVDGARFNLMALNNRPLFHMGTLDQGWWPDGLYTAPTDEALRFDVMKTRQWGFNMIRKHIKVEPARWYYWCDVEGIMVWQDMPCIADHSMNRKPGKGAYRGEELNRRQVNKWRTMSPVNFGTDCDVPQEWKDNYYKEWGEIISCLKNFQCIVVWVPFNEAWGQFDTEKVVAFTRNQDSTRLINEASGGNYHFAGDIMDCHRYPSPMMPFFDIDRMNVLGEFGGIGYVEKGHIWNPKMSNWGYNGTKGSHEEVTATYEDFASMLRQLVRTGTCGAVYTQTTDVEGEVNGIMTYDRKIVKMDENRLKKANESIIAAMSLPFI